jgi:hypothetical protein
MDFPLDEITVETEVSKEESKKKNVFSLSSVKTGTKILLLAPSDSDLDEWADAIIGASLTQNSDHEYSSSNMFYS